jgi:hypothetical protein
MSQENVEIVLRSFERISEGRPAWELLRGGLPARQPAGRTLAAVSGPQGAAGVDRLSNDVAEEWELTS